MSVGYIRYVDKVPEVVCIANDPGCFISGYTLVNAWEEVVVAGSENDGWSKSSCTERRCACCENQSFCFSLMKKVSALRLVYKGVEEPLTVHTLESHGPRVHFRPR